MEQEESTGVYRGCTLSAIGAHVTGHVDSPPELGTSD